MNLEKKDENENKLNIIANKTKYSLPNVTFPCRNLPWKINNNGDDNVFESLLCAMCFYMHSLI